MQVSNFEDKKYQRLPSRAKYIVSSVYRNGILDGNLCSDRQRLLNGNWIEGNSTAFDDTTQSLLGKIPPTAQDIYALLFLLVVWYIAFLIRWIIGHRCRICISAVLIWASMFG